MSKITAKELRELLRTPKTAWEIAKATGLDAADVTDKLSKLKGVRQIRALGRLAYTLDSE